MTILAIDIGGTFIKYGLIEDDNQLSQQGKLPTPDNLDAFWATLETIVAQFKDEAQGIAVACPGEINARSGHVFRGGLIPYLVNIPLGARLKELMDLPVTVINDGEAAGLCEAQVGNLQGYDCAATLVLGTGVGLALVSQGQLASMFTLGQRLRLGGGPRQEAEKRQAQWDIFRQSIRNLLDNTGSAVGFVKQASQLLDLDEPDGLKVFNALKAGENEELLALFRRYCQDIAGHIYTLQSLVTLEAVSIGGGISAQPLLLEGIKQAYLSYFSDDEAEPFQAIPIVPCNYGNASNLIGAACHFRDLQAA